MAYKSLMQFVEELETNNLLIRITAPVSTELEITEIADRISKQPGGGKALLFENNGTKFPLLINALGSDNAMKLALNVSNYDDITDEIQQLFKTIAGPKNSLLEKIKTLPVLSGIAAWLPKVKSGRGVCQEVVHENPDLGILPVLKCWPFDGGKFITFPMVNTKDP
ncbi:MAG TPA: menaquinone biosynthesis decarboxylase, partial [Bacteroidales bacterium]|nr:menaquinone biosynthesis decarboxylase [Bacteroidales bacterium]